MRRPARPCRTPTEDELRNRHRRLPGASDRHGRRFRHVRERRHDPQPVLRATGHRLARRHRVPAPRPGTSFARPKVANDVGVTLAPIANWSGVPLADGRPSAAKTGTEGIQSGPASGQNSDAWMVGYTPQVSAAVWVGQRQQHDRDHRRLRPAGVRPRPARTHLEAVHGHLSRRGPTATDADNPADRGWGQRGAVRTAPPPAAVVVDSGTAHVRRAPRRRPSPSASRFESGHLEPAENVPRARPSTSAPSRPRRSLSPPPGP